jgi:hypothetical protein
MRLLWASDRLLVPRGSEPVLLALILLFALYMGWEIWRWMAGNPSLLTPGQFRRRLVGGVLLELDLLMWLFANALMQHRRASEKLLYLLTAVLFILIPLMLAVREAGFVARQYVKWRGELARSLGRSDREANG